MPPSLSALPRGRIAFEGVVFDQESMSIAFQGRAVTPLQRTYHLAFYLFSRAGQLCTRGELLRDVWGCNTTLKTRRIDSQVSRFRGHLQTLDCPYEIAVIPNEGYLLNITPRLR